MEIVFGMASLILALVDFWLRNQYARSLPHFANSAVGRTYPLNTHGRVVYLTSSEHTPLHTLIISSEGLFVGVILIDVLKKPFRP